MAVKNTNNGGFILLVEDDRGTSELEAQRLEPLGLEIRRAAGPEETTAILKKETPELMLLDYSLAEGNALELLKSLKAGGIVIPPFLVVTGRGDEAIAIEAMKSGALDYIIKNADFLDNLLPAAQKALEKAKLLRDLETAQKSTAKNLHLYSFLAQVNLAAAQTKEARQLFQKICDIAVNTGGIRMAWIGLADNDFGRIMPFCSSGFVNGYLDSIKISTTAGSPGSGGPTGTAAATGKISTSPDISVDPAMAPLREKALERGYRSSAAIPLQEGGKLAGVLTIYSEQPEFFTGEELKLLNEIKADISLALEAISAEKKRASAQAALERTARQLAHIMDVNPVILFTLKQKGTVVITDWVSGNSTALTGYSPEEMLTPGWWIDHLHPHDKERVIEEQNELFKKPMTTQDFRFLRKDGSYFWVHAQMRVSQDTAGEITGSWTDITRLKESEERLQELFDRAPVGYQAIDEEGRLTAVNEPWIETFGFDKNEVLGRRLRDFITPEFASFFEETFAKYKNSGETFGVELEIIRKDRQKRRIYVTGRVAQAPNGSFRQAHCIFTDITGTYKTKKQLDLLNLAIRTSFNEIYIFSSADLKFIFANKSALDNLGYTVEEMERLTPWDLQKDLTEAAFRKALEPLLQKTKSVIILEAEHTRKNGTVYPVEVRLQLIETEAEPVFLTIIDNITERKKSERMIQDMASMQRVESLGALAGGIAHDFNNMLTGITANLSLLSAKPGCDQESMEIIRDTMEAARNAQGLTSQLLAFSKGGRPVKKEFCLEKALKEIFKLATSGTKHSCELAIPGSLWSIEADENQFKQAVNNLLINAIQAMPSGGKLTLRAENTNCSVMPSFAGGDCVKITVSDTGIGIPAKYLDRIFEPYFTTKNQGHGLGLSMTWSVIKNHGGHIEARSEPGKGTTFELCLPSTGRCLQEQKTSSPKIPKGSGRVLVLEDEEIVSRAVVRMVEQLGYACQLTADGKETVRAYIEAKEAGRPFDIVIMDLTIPGGLGGKEAVQELRRVAPSVPVIVSSGYSDEAVMANYKDYGFSAVLPKPYKYEDLAETLARLLKK